MQNFTSQKQGEILCVKTNDSFCNQTISPIIVCKQDFYIFSGTKKPSIFSARLYYYSLISVPSLNWNTILPSWKTIIFAITAFQILSSNSVNTSPDILNLFVRACTDSYSAFTWPSSNCSSSKCSYFSRYSSVKPLVYVAMYLQIQSLRFSVLCHLAEKVLAGLQVLFLYF